METICTTVSSSTFLSNFEGLKKKMREPLPTDVVLLQCEKCLINMPLNICGVIKVDNPLQESVSITLDAMLKNIRETHTQESEQCALAKMHLHPVLRAPNNICCSFSSADSWYVNDFTLEDTSYILKVMVINPDTKVIFALYQEANYEKDAYTEFLKCNFNTFLDTKCTATEDIFDEDWIQDDEGVNDYQHLLPRMTGGGRKIRSDFNYVCLWCPKDDVKKGKKGRFKEIKNYRDHFKKYHYGENGEGIPMSEFIKKTTRCEPTWFCQNCKQHYSLGNQIRHQAICHLESSASDSDTEEEIPNKSRKKTNIKIMTTDNNNEVQVHDVNKEQSENDHTNLECSTSRQATFTQKTGGSSMDVDNLCSISKPAKSTHRTGGSSMDVHNAKTMSVLTKGISRKGKTKDNINIIEDITVIHPDRTRLIGNVFSSEDSNKNRQSKQEKIPKAGLFVEVADCIYLSSEDEEVLETELEVKVELPENIYEVGPSSKEMEHINKWWHQVPKHHYADRGLGGPQIFLPSDSDEFVKRVSENCKKHMAEKAELDKKMLLAESGDERFYQFSIERDQPFLDKYKEFVQSLTAKDVLHIFSDEYEELDVPTGAKSSTAIQYTYRMMEFFKFMANIYRNFHFDWMCDFQCKIEKTHPNGDVSNDIFLPTKQNLTDFIKQFKYGTNPAANCGVRIFALKKLMDFLSQEIKDNEHSFGSDMIQNSGKVGCLLQKLKNLNMSICPEGTIKHLATASNKSHKRTLMEQLAKCPERTTSSIMKGVSDYVDSEEYNTEKTKLMEFAYKKAKVPTSNDYMNSTNWLLEQLICVGGNRPCALLGITLRDWEERRTGYCPFNQSEDNDMHEEDPENDKRKVLQDPYKRPKGSSAEEPTGVIVTSETDKIVVGPPCYIWFPNALVDLVKAHALITQKVLPRSVDIYHPKTRLFLNTNGKPIKKIECMHLKNYIGLPIVAYDFRRSLSTFCLDSKNEVVRQSESSVLRHKEQTGFAYYYQKHSEKVEYVSIQYAVANGLLKANTDSVDAYCDELKRNAANDEWELIQKRTDKALEYSHSIIQKRKQSLNDAKQKGGRNWILPAEYDSFIEGIEEAMKMEENKLKVGTVAGPFAQLLKYKPETEGAGAFPPPALWFVDMYRVLYGLTGKIGDEMRKVELSVYDGVPFSTGLSGRKKIKSVTDKNDITKPSSDMIVATYWRDKIKEETRNRVRGKWLPLRFIFTEKDFDYHKEQVKVKTENI